MLSSLKVVRNASLDEPSCICQSSSTPVLELRSRLPKEACLGNSIDKSNSLTTKCTSFSSEYLMKHTSLSLEAPEMQMADCLIDSLRGKSSPSLEAPEVQTHAILNGIIKAMRRKHAMFTYDRTMHSRRAKVHSRPRLSVQGRIGRDTEHLCSSLPKLSAAVVITVRTILAGDL